MDGVEKQLIALTNALNNLESKLLDNSKKMKDFEDIIRAIKQEESKKISAQLGEKNENSADEMKKLKADFLTIKNKDIEKIKLDIHDLNEAIKQIHGTTH
jgi:biotin synthase-like enzyme